MKEISQLYSDRDFTNDLMTSQQAITNQYNSAAFYSETNELHNEIIDLLFREHSIYSDLLKEADKRSWIKSLQASDGLIANIKETLN